MKNLKNNATAVKTVIISVCILFKRVMCGLELCKFWIISKSSSAKFFT